MRKCVVRLIALAILLVALVGFSYIEIETDEIRGNADYQLFTNNDCAAKAFWSKAKYTGDEASIPANVDETGEGKPRLETSDPKVKKYAFETQVRTELNRTHFNNNNKKSSQMICFCEKYYVQQSFSEILGLAFKDVNKNDPEGIKELEKLVHQNFTQTFLKGQTEQTKSWDEFTDEHYCREIQLMKVWQYFFVFAVSLVTIIINESAVFIFEKFVHFEKNHTQNQETYGLFRKIIILQVLDTCFVNLLVNLKIFDGEGTKEWAWLCLLMGSYKDFESEWYINVGKPLVRTLLMNIILQFDVFTPCLAGFGRCCDRRCRWKLYDEETDTINTKCIS